MDALTLRFPRGGLPWLERLLLVAAGLLALYALLGFVVVPRIAKSKIESVALEQLGRKATVGKVQFNPFSLRARVSDFRLADREPGRTLLRFDAMDLNVSSESVWRRAPVFDAVRIVRPRLELALDANGRSSIQDLLERPSTPQAAEEPTFAFNNIEIEDGAIVLDDALRRRRIEVTKLGVGIPFLSSFARDAEIRVKPHLQGAVDGAPFALTGTSTSPFEDVQRATLDVNLDALALPKYMAYAPMPSGIRLSDGALTTRLTVAFVTWKGKPRGITLAGRAQVDGLAFARNDGSRLGGARSLVVDVANLDVFARRAVVNRIAIAAPDVDVRRLRDGRLEMPGLLALPGASGGTATKTAAAATAPRAGWAWSLAEASISDGTASIADESVAPAFRTGLSAISIAAKDFASDGAPGTASIALRTEDGARFEAHTLIDVTRGSAQGRFALAQLPLARLAPYYTSALAMDVRSGSLDAAGRFDAVTAPAFRFTLAEGSASASDIDLAIEGEREPLGRVARLEATGIELDSARHVATVGSIEGRGPDLRVLREADGRIHAERVLRARAGVPPPSEASGAADAAAWRVTVQRLLLDGMGADFEDRTVSPPVKLRIADARIEAHHLDTAPGEEATVDVDARVGAKGRVQLEGTATARPLAADISVNAAALDLVALRPYFQARTNVIVTSGAVSARGRASYAAGTAGPDLRYAGNVIVSNFDSLDRPGSRELVRWKTLALTGTDLGTAPFKLGVDAVAVDRFYARLILDANAKLNVLQLLKPEGAQEAAPAAAPRPAPARRAAPIESLATETGTTIAPDEEEPPPAAAPAPRNDIPVSIGRIQLTNGEVEFSDFFVKPNYSAHLTQVSGRVSALSPRRAGNVQVTARLDGAAPVEISGTVNPFAKELAVDITGKATDVDLPPLTPYSVKYAGYGIQKGKLSMEVHYKVANRKLAATNKLVLNQLTFGERVDSPTATKLPVLFIVRLLQDRDGVIRLDLPISGTIDDPKFSLGRVIVQVIVNLFTKAATAPFALLGSIVGGGEELAYVEFAPGEAVLAPAAQAKLASLSKALVERPGLKIDAAGRAIPDVDGPALRRAALEREIRIRKQKDMAEAGQSAPPLEEIPVAAADYAKYLKPIYRETDLPDKPRNFIGMQKDIPAQEMERRLLEGYRVDETALRELANHRAQVVREWLTTQGNVAAERVFVVAPKLGAEGLGKEGAPTRVDFAIK
ncbi:MAG TPA: DUF748 domain-containing protein [Usitatibacter sp.]|nr:DUF748 domain-containing protein [Usitatibacter sp.]